MGLNLDPDLRLAGYRIATFKEALRGFARTGWRGSVIDLKTLFALRKDGAILVEECLDRGLIDPDTLAITPEGEAIARAKLVPRTPLGRAIAVLEGFLNHIDMLNRDEDVIRRVDQAWLYGSLLREEETVGDIDLALTFSWRPRFREDHEARRCHVEAMLAGFGKGPPVGAEPWVRQTWLDHRLLFGSRRQPLLAGVQDGIADLASMGVPCRLVFDRARGGRVSDPVLPRHPASTGRDPRLEPPARPPDLTPAAIRPMDARWVTAFRKTGGVDSHDIFRGQPEIAWAWFPSHPHDLRVFGDDHDLQHTVWAPARLRKRGLDGREAVCLLNASRSRGTSLVLGRHIEITADRWTLHAGLRDIETYRSRGKVAPATLPDLAAVVAILLLADVERMTRRAAELARPPSISVRIDEDGVGDEIRRGIVDVVRRHLARELGPGNRWPPGAPTWHARETAPATLSGNDIDV